MERKMVTLRTIDKILPHNNADSLELAMIGGWQVVVRKGEYYEGQQVFYAEIDSMIPLDRNYFKFLASRGVKVVDGKEYHKLRTAKLRGEYSQGLIFPFSYFSMNPYSDWNEEQQIPSKYFDPDDCVDKELEIMENGGDFSEYFGVFKYEPPVPEELKGKVLAFPGWVRKTDEERIQNIEPEVLESFINNPNFIATEKVDGTSCTIWAKKNGDTIEYGVASRNNGWVEDDTNMYWRVARAPIMPGSLLNYAKDSAATLGDIVLQGELFGENIQSNPYGCKGQFIRLFNLIINGRAIPYDEIKAEFPELLPFWVPVHENKLPATIKEMLEQVDGITTKIPEATKPSQIEGFVWRDSKNPTTTIGEEIVRNSFKVISNKYLLKHEN